MEGDNMELMQIKYFLEVAESEHITMSAEKLHIAQPALTQAIKRFEPRNRRSAVQKAGKKHCSDRVWKICAKEAETIDRGN